MYRDSHWLDINQSTLKMKIRSFFITIFVVAFALLYYGEAKRCYDCDSRTSKTCAFEPSSREITECPTTNCATCYYDSYNDEILIRSCHEVISESEPQFHIIYSYYCDICDEDLCNKFNNANMATVSMTLGCLVSFCAIRFVLINSY